MQNGTTFTFNNIDFSNVLKVEDVRRPVLAPQKISSIAIEGRPGAVFYRKTPADYVIEVDYSIVEGTQTEMRNQVLDIADKIDTDAPAKLIFTDESDKFYWAIISDETEFETTYQVGKGTLLFWVYDPFRYALSDDVFTYTTAGAKSFTRKGTAPSYPLVSVKGVSGSGGSYTLKTDSNTIKFTGTLTSSQTLIFDTELLTAYIVKSDSSKVSAVPNLNSLDFPVLVRGQNNFTITLGGGATLSECKVTCRSRWK